MQLLATALWAAGLAGAAIADLLDRAPARLKHGGPWVAFVLIFTTPIGIAFATVATGLPWWAVTLTTVAVLVLCIIFAAAKRETKTGAGTVQSVVGGSRE